MSDDLKRSKPDFSMYDSMSIEELEEILRADAQGPERADSDVDEILYIMEVLVKKRNENGIAGKTALEAYQEFQQHFLPVVEEDSQPRHKTKVIPFRWIAAVAASLVLVFSLTTTANAFCFRDVWNAVVTWAQETFSLSMGYDINEPSANDIYEYATFKDILSQNGRDPEIIPSAIPAGYTLSDVVIDKKPNQETFLAIYLNDNKILKISVQSLLDRYPEQVEMSDGFQDVYSVDGVDYYIFSNYNQNRAAWTIGTYECYISGEISIEELKSMIESIGKG